MNRAWLIGVLWTPGMAWAECPSTSASLSQAQQQVMTFDMVGADESLARAIEGFGCGSAATPELAARYHQVRAHRLLWASDPNQELGEASLRASRAAEPEYWAQAWGEQYKELWETGTADGSGTLRVSGLPSDWKVWVDGALVERSPQVLSGPHLVQVGPTPEDMRWAQVVVVPVDERVTAPLPVEVVNPPTAAEAAESASEAVVSTRKPRKMVAIGLTSAGAGLALVSGVQFVRSMSLHGQYTATGSDREAELFYQEQFKPARNLAAGTGLGAAVLLGSGAGLLVGPVQVSVGPRLFRVEGRW